MREASSAVPCNMQNVRHALRYRSRYWVSSYAAVAAAPTGRRPLSDRQAHSNLSTGRAVQRRGLLRGGRGCHDAAGIGHGPVDISIPRQPMAGRMLAGPGRTEALTCTPRPAPRALDRVETACRAMVRWTARRAATPPPPRCAACAGELRRAPASPTPASSTYAFNVLVIVKYSRA